EMKKRYPDIRADQYHVDGLSIQLVLNPDRFDVIVASNLFGDILSDLGPATAGTIGIAPSGNINPERTAPSIFEPVHGSAPDIAGKKIANPIGAIWSGALMLEHLGHAAAAADVVRAIERVVKEGPYTPDMKGKASTSEVGAAVADAGRAGLFGRGQLHLQICILSGTDQADRHHVARLMPLERIEQLVQGRDRLAVDRGDDVARDDVAATLAAKRLDAGGGRRAARHHAQDRHALRQSQRGLELGRAGAQAERRARKAPVADQARHDSVHFVHG